MTEEIFLDLTNTTFPRAILSIFGEFLVARATKTNEVPVLRNGRVVINVVVIKLICGPFELTA